MNIIAKYVIIFLFLSGCFLSPTIASAHQPRLVYLQSGDVQIKNPEVSQAFYDELKGAPRDYFINSSKDFELYINLLVPDPENKDGRYSANVFLLDEKDAVVSLLNGDNADQINTVDGISFDWQGYYESFGRDYYLKGPEFSRQVPAGKYKIEVFSLGYSPLGRSSAGEAKDNQGKYVLAVGQKESFGVLSILNAYWQLPLLKMSFFKTSVLQFFLTPFGIGGIGLIGAILILWALINYLIGLVKTIIMHNEAKTLLLTSDGMPQMKDEITKLLQKPAYDVTVAFITTAAKTEGNIDYLQRDWDIMKDELGFNVEEVDIDGKSESQLMNLLELKDIIFVEGGSTFYLLKAMRACNFGKVIRKLLKVGKVYIGASAGSIVAGKNIQTSDWKGPEERFNVKNLKGLNLVPFDIFVHYKPEHAELIKQKMPNPKKRARYLKILTDDQGILVQGKEIDLIGDGEAVIV